MRRKLAEGEGRCRSERPTLEKPCQRVPGLLELPPGRRESRALVQPQTDISARGCVPGLVGQPLAPLAQSDSNPVAARGSTLHGRPSSAAVSIRQAQYRQRQYTARQAQKGRLDLTSMVRRRVHHKPLRK